MMILEQFPSFSTIEPDAIISDLKHRLDQNRLGIQAMVNNPAPPTWENTLALLEDQEEALSQWWSPIAHLHHVKNNPALREAYEAALPALSAYATEMGQNRGLYERLVALSQSVAFNNLDIAQQKIIENHLRDFTLAGVALAPEQQALFKQLDLELVELSNTFENHVMDATDQWFYHVTDPLLLAGIPEGTLCIAAEAAKIKGLEGWLLTLDYPCYSAVLTYAKNAVLREKLYHAYVTRASGESVDKTLDNAPIIHEILQKRQTLSELLGFNHYAELSLATKMVEHPKQVFDFLEQLIEKVRPQAILEYAALQQFAKKLDNIETLAPWDISYYSEALKKSLHQVDDEALRVYFPIQVVWAGLSAIVQRLYGITLKEKTGVDVWHDAVQCYRLQDENGQCRGYLYADLYARSQKRGGAWMDECVARKKTSEGIQIPIAFLTCNFQPPTQDKPALLTHDDVVTVFHECGHCLQHLLTQVDYSGVSGIQGVPWDAVELASQFMENWCWQKEALTFISSHYKTNEPLPINMLDNLLKSCHFHSALGLLRQLEMSLFDFTLHAEYTARLGQSAQAVYEDIRAQVSVVPFAPYNRFPCGFSHIFGGGYAAGYYSYLWAEVLACDAFSVFEENGIFDHRSGRRFMQCFLETGGTNSPMIFFKAFRGREPTLNALLKHRGIVGKFTN